MERMRMVIGIAEHREKLKEVFSKGFLCGVLASAGSFILGILIAILTNGGHI